MVLLVRPASDIPTGLPTALDRRRTPGGVTQHMACLWRGNAPMGVVTGHLQAIDPADDVGTIVASEWTAAVMPDVRSRNSIRSTPRSGEPRVVLDRQPVDRLLADCRERARQTGK
jgi:hypothetical protein